MNISEWQERLGKNRGIDIAGFFSFDTYALRSSKGHYWRRTVARAWEVNTTAQQYWLLRLARLMAVDLATRRALTRLTRGATSEREARWPTDAATA
jgi:hypothetical protein